MASNPRSTIQYGCRDEDDDSDDGRRRRSSKLQFLSRESSKRQLKKFNAIISDTKSLLKGASGTPFLYGMDKSSGSLDDDSSSYYDDNESDNDSDASDNCGSVCSKASVASKASKAVKKLGGKLRGSIKMVGGGKRRDSKEEKTPGGDDDDDDTASVQSNTSRSSRASDAVRRVSGKLGKALKVAGGGRRKSHKNKGELYEDLSDDSLSSCEDDLFLTPTPSTRRGPDDRPPSRKPVARTKSFDDNYYSTPAKIENDAPPFRRSSTTTEDVTATKKRSSKRSSNPDVVESLKKNEYNWNMNVPPSLVLDSVTYGGNTSKIRAA